MFEYNELLIEKEIETSIADYKKLSAGEQLAKFENLYNFFFKPGMPKHHQLTLIMSTKPTIFLNYKKGDKKNKSDIDRIVKAFGKIINMLNVVKVTRVEDFINRLSTAEQNNLYLYIEKIALTISLYQQNMPSFANKDIKKIEKFLKLCNESLSKDLKSIQLVYKEYEKNPNRLSFKKLLELRKNIFSDTAQKFKYRGIIFLSLTILSMLILISWGVFLIYQNLIINPIIDDVDIFAKYSSIGGKLIVTATLFFILSACLRVYFALKHNETICQQRADTLASYEKIYDVAGDNKNLVLEKVTEAVFTQLPTGFSKLQSNDSKSANGLDSPLVRFVIQNHPALK